jgi:hypothetical protein
VGFNAWHLPTSAGATIQDACNYAMTFTASTSNETERESDLYPHVAAVASIYGDPDGKYAQWLAGKDKSFPSQPYFLWNQPLSNAGLSGAPTSPVSANTPNDASGLGIRVVLSWLNCLFVFSVLNLL